jgi:predicted TIM-barrel fold metal-dependent hydrolase
MWPNDGSPPPWEGAAEILVKHGGDSLSPAGTLNMAAEAGVDRIVLVPPSFKGDSNVFGIEVASEYKGRFGIMGRVSLTDPGQWRDMSEWRSQGGMLGVRVSFSRGPSATWLTDGTADWFWSEAETHDIPVMIFPGGQLSALAKIVTDHPALSLIIDHAAIPSENAASRYEAVVDEVCQLARFSNVSVKASALPSAIPEPFPFPTACQIARRLLDSFGLERVYWGSDYTRVKYTYVEGATYLAESGKFSGEELAWVMGRGISQVLRWPVGS